MSTLRSIRLLNSVEAGTTTGAQLETYLADIGRRSELSVLLSNRGQSRRMAGSPTTMTAISASPAAINIVFQAATATTSAACQAVTASPIAMNTVANSLAGLNVLGANTVSWGMFTSSIYYQSNLKSVIALYAGVSPSIYPTIASLIADPVAMADIAVSAYAMNAVVADLPTTTLVANSSTAMSLVTGNAVAIGIIAAQTSVMGVVAGSATAMSAIVASSAATASMASQPGAILAISNSATGWATYMAGSYFANNLPTVLANLIGVSTITYPSINSIIADATALAKVAANKAAVQALASNSAAMDALAVSANIGIMLGSTIAMSVIGPNSTAMTSFLNAAGAWAGLFASSVAKGYIIASTALVNVIAGNSSLITYLGTFAKTLAASGTPDGNATSLQPFTGAPAKLLTLAAKEVGIAATYSNYNFGGTPMSGSQAGATLSLSGTGSGGQPAHIAGYTNMTWNFQGVGVTAATLPIITYVDMT